MKLSTLACRVALVGVLTHCGSGSGGSAGSSAIGQSSDPGGPYAGMGNSGPLEQGQNVSNPFARYVNGGPASGQGSAGPYSSPGSPGPLAPMGAGGGCSAFCAKVATVPCSDSNNQSDTPANGQSCEQGCTAELAQLNTDCLRNLYGAFLGCIVSASLTCEKGKLQAPSCAEPKNSQCAGGTPEPVDNTSVTPPAEVDGGR